jgi:hypothetical protein
VLNASTDGNWCHDTTGLCVRQHKGMMCNVLTDNSTSCPEPSASAYDHHDESHVEVNTTRVLWIASYPGVAPVQVFEKVDDISYNQRGHYILYYDAIDRAGNQAEQLPFGMQLVDHVDCEIHPASWWNDLEVESNDHTAIDGCTGAECDRFHGECRNLLDVPSFAVNATDDYDPAGPVSDRLLVSLSGPAGADCGVRTLAPTAPNADEAYTIDLQCVGNHTFSYSTKDYANIFGKNNLDNECELEMTITVVDTTVPETTCNGILDHSIGGHLYHDSIHGIGTFGPDDVISTVSGITDIQDCKEACTEQRVERFSSKATSETDGCRYYELCSASQNCKLYADVPEGTFDCNTTRTCTSPNEQGKLRLCENVTHHECKAPYVDGGAHCLDVRDSMSYTEATNSTNCSTSVDVDKLAPVSKIPAALLTADGPPVADCDVVYL